MKRLLIAGGSGNLGRSLSALAARHWDTVSTYFKNPSVGGGRAIQLDLRDREMVLDLVRDVKPDVIFHAATSDRSEDMVTTIHQAAQNIVEAAQESGARLITLSTDLVFDGRAAPYAEDAPPTPTTPYGQIKAEIERLFLQEYDNCLIVRTSLIYDLDRTNQQIRWMERNIAEGKPVNLFVDEFRQPIWAWNLGEVLLELAAQNVTGILHVAGPERLSRWEYGNALLQALGYDPLVVARPVRAAEAAPHRPHDCTLRLDRALELLTTRLIPLREALRRAQENRPEL